MAVFAISDLHLSFQTEKPMDKFGGVWKDYEEKMRARWNQTVSPSDLVLIPGDVSWATYLEEAVEDFSYLNGLNGKKLISKGNHDYWWETVTKLNGFLAQNGFDTIGFVYNNTVLWQDCAICGTKGFDYTIEQRLRNREMARLELSLQEGAKTGKEIVLMLHYPPFTKEGILIDGMDELFSKYGVKQCVYGHLHGARQKNAVNEKIGLVDYKLVSCDFIDMTPVFIR